MAVTRLVQTRSFPQKRHYAGCEHILAKRLFWAGGVHYLLVGMAHSAGLVVAGADPAGCVEFGLQTAEGK